MREAFPWGWLRGAIDCIVCDDMATTDARLALSALAAVERTGVRLAVIHGADRLLAGESVSDVDLVVDRPVRELVAASVAAWREAGLSPVIVWPYDVGGTGSVFLFTPDASEGVQLDVLFDPRGSGQYGVRSSALLRHASPGEGFPRVSEEAAAIYLVSKRARKGRREEAEAAMRRLERPHFEELLVEIVDEPIARRLRRYLAGQSMRKRRPAMVGRFGDRLTNPVGAWVRVVGEAGPLGAELADRFGRVLPVTAAPGRVGPIGWLREVAPVRWRAGIAFTDEARIGRGWPEPDVEVDAGMPVGRAAGKVVDRLSRRYG